MPGRLRGVGLHTTSSGETFMESDLVLDLLEPLVGAKSRRGAIESIAARKQAL